MMTRFLTLALLASLAAVAPTSAFATAVFQSFELSANGSALSPSPSLPPSTTVGTKTSVNVAASYTGGGYSFTIGPSPTTAIPTVFGVDSTLDQIGFTGGLITYVSGPTTAVDLTVLYKFSFPGTSLPQTYGVQMAGAFGRAGAPAATGDSVTDTSSVVFPGDVDVTDQIGSPITFIVGTVNTFVPPKPQGNPGKDIITCPDQQNCTFNNMETQLVFHFGKSRDTVTIPNSFIVVRADGDDQAAADAVQEFLDAEAAADAAALPEPNTLALFLGSGLVGLGLSRLKQVRGRVRKDRRD